MSPSHIQKLFQDGGRYDESSLDELEPYLQEQLKTNTYDLDANLAILKLYLLYPEETNVDKMEGILIKALMAFPATDFSLCMYQIPEKHHQSLREVCQLAQQLEMAKFKTFWKESESVECLSQAVGWEAAVRKFIAGVVSSTYRSIKADQLTELLNLSRDDREVEALLKERGWTFSEDDPDVIIVSTSTFENVTVEPKPPSHMSLDQYRALFGAATGA